MGAGVRIYPNSERHALFDATAMRITAQCMGIPEEVQRPLRTRYTKAVQLNVREGSTGAREAHMRQWLQQQAARGVLFVGLCELNGWERVYSVRELVKHQPMIVFRAANAGFAYSHILSSSEHPYHLGIIAAKPFEVVAEYRPPLLQRGLLHVHFPAEELHVLVVHLHAHDASLRTKEAQFIVSTVLQPLLDAGAKFMLMGDFNTLSPCDARWVCTHS